MRINLPNQITIGRLVLAVIFFILLAQYEARLPEPRVWLLDVSAGVFLLAAISDIVDGHLARKHNQVTSFGRIVDPFVDKVLVIGAYVFFAGEGFVDGAGRQVSDVSGWMVVVILGRELFVTSLRGMREAGGNAFAATVYGKVKMLLQSVTIMWVLLSLAHPTWPATLIAMRPVLVYVTVAVTFLSIIPYLKMARGELMQMSAASP
jgi:CDP-diacylglycerol--glycerol-3-phosphate 3-phosphatidyltransferase